MFANFIYFIVALLIYATHQPSENPHFSAIESLLLFAGVTLLYTVTTFIPFNALNKRLQQENPVRIENRFSAHMNRQSILALLFFAVDIYGINLPSFFIGIALFDRLPTLRALVFISIFVLYLAIMWAAAFPLYKRLYVSGMSRRAYIGTNISFAVPVLLPWFVLSGVADLIEVLPFQGPKIFLASFEGQVTYFLVFLVLVSVFGPPIIKTFWRCKPLAAGLQRRRIEDLCARAGIAYRDILNWPIFEGRMITAGVMGLLGRFRYILVTKALLVLLRPDELEAVIAHEIGHVKRRHLLLYLFFFIGYMILSFALFDLFFYALIYLDPVIHFFRAAGLDEGTIVSAIMSVLFISAFLVYFRFIFGYFMRHFERQADTHVFRMFDSARPLISTLQKIASTSAQPIDKPNWHHFSIRERMQFLLQCETNPRMITRHDQRLKRHLWVYTLCFLLIGGIAYQLNYGRAGSVLNSHFFEKIIVREIQRSPQSPGLLTTLGDLHYSRGSLQKAAAAYEKAIRQNQDHVRALNNLAWLYATATESALKRPERALALAERAAALSPRPHVLDTLAQCYFVNGRIAAALTAAQKALQAAEKDRSYYESQLAKFRQALE